MIVPGWLVVAVETSLAWPTEDTHIQYKGHDFLLRPGTDETAATVCLRFGPTVSDISRKEAISLLRGFLSALSWTEGYYIRELMVSMSGHLIQIGKPGRTKIINPNFRADHLPEVEDRREKLALALYREALSVNSIPYQFLGYFKTINILHEQGRQQKNWIRSTLPHITNREALERLSILNAEQNDVADYLYESGRCAIAHAYSEPIVDPEDPDDLRRLQQDLPIVKALAEYLIEFELGIPSLRTIHRLHLYQLDGFRPLVGQEIIDRLKAGESDVSLEGVTLPRLSIRLRDYEPFATLENLIVEAGGTVEGRLILQCTSDRYPTVVLVSLHFAAERLEFEPFEYIKVINDDSTRESDLIAIEIDVLNFEKGLIGNAQIEVWNADAGELLGRTAPFIPMNIDFVRTFENFDTRLGELQQRLEQLADEEDT